MAATFFVCLSKLPIRLRHLLSSPRQYADIESISFVSDNSSYVITFCFESSSPELAIGSVPREQII